MDWRVKEKGIPERTPSGVRVSGGEGHGEEPPRSWVKKKMGPADLEAALPPATPPMLVEVIVDKSLIPGMLLEFSSLPSLFVSAVTVGFQRVPGREGLLLPSK